MLTDTSPQPPGGWLSSVWSAPDAGITWFWVSCALVLAVALLAGGLVVMWRRLETIRHRLRSESAARKQAERSLTDQENRLQTIFESQPECVKLHAADGTILAMNRAGLALIGAQCAEQVA
jgi:PAS domain-containing protein